MVFLLLISVTFSRTPYHSYIGGHYRWVGGIIIVSDSIPSSNDPAKDLILVHTVQLKPIIKEQIAGRMVSSGISDVAFASINTEKTCLKKLMKIIIIITEKPFTIK